MKTTHIFSIAAAAAVLAVQNLSAADSGKEVTLNGKAVCAKCAMHEAKECQNVVQVSENGKTTNYYLAQNDVSKNFHDEICSTAGEQVTVTGTVSEKDGKEVLTASKITPVK